jgi:multicomponent Na+:H+ antiporter subunit E
MSRTLSKPIGHSLIARAALFSALWLIIAGDDPSSWIIGVPTIVLATWGSLQLRGIVEGNSTLCLSGLIRFIPFFVIESFRGGLDVASRVLRPRLRVAPGFQSYRPELANPAARVVFLDTISLLPGTLSADMRDGVVLVHALDARIDLTPELARLERMVGLLFGERLKPPPA